MKLSVIIINYNTIKMTEQVIKRFLVVKGQIDAEIIVVDNGSSEKINCGQLEKKVDRVILNDKNIGFAGAVNQGIEGASGEYILLLNSDVFLLSGSIVQLLNCLNNKDDIGISGTQMIYPNGDWQISFGRFPTFLSEFLRFSLLYKLIPGGTFICNTIFNKIDLKNEREVDWVSGGCMLIKKEVIDKIGNLDQDYFLGVEDIDFCYRAKKAGYKIIYVPSAKAVHKHGGSSGCGGTRNIQRIKLDRDGFDTFFKKHRPWDFLGRFLVRLMHNLKIILLK